MEKIYIGFSHHKKSLLSSAIRFIEDSEYSHVYIRKESKYGSYVYQASGLQVNFMNTVIFLKENIVVEEYEFELDDIKKNKLLAFFIRYAGAKYAITSLFKLMAIVLGQKIGLNVKFQGDGDNTFICSELAAFLSKEILEIKVPEDMDFITPKQLNPIVREHGLQVI